MGAATQQKHSTVLLFADLICGHISSVFPNTEKTDSLAMTKLQHDPDRLPAAGS
jgi:hypothetical protein